MRIYTFETGNQGLISAYGVRPPMGPDWKVDAKTDPTGEIGDSCGRLISPEGEILASIMLTQRIKQDIIDLITKDIAAQAAPPASVPQLAERIATAAGGVLPEPGEDQPEQRPADLEPDIIHEIPIDKIGHFPGGNQRKVFRKLDELAESIRVHGIRQPLLVNEIDGQYTLVAGERRLRAAGLAGLRTVPCLISHMPEAVALEIMLIENIQREDLNPMEEAEAYGRLLAIPGSSQVTVAKRIGKSQQYVNEYIQLLSLPESMQAEVSAENISVRTALQFLRQTRHVPDHVREQVGARVVLAQPTAREAPYAIDQLLQELTGQPTARAVPAKKDTPAPAAQSQQAPAKDPGPASAVAKASEQTGASPAPAAPAQENPPAKPVAPAPAPAAPQTQEERPVKQATVTPHMERAASLAAMGQTAWGALGEDGGEILVAKEAYLPLERLFAHWQMRKEVGAQSVPTDLGEFRIDLSELTIWVEPGYSLEDHPAVEITGAFVQIRNENGGLRPAHGNLPVYYRVEIRNGHDNMGTYRQQLVMQIGPHHILATGRAGVMIKPDLLPMIQDLVNELPGLPVAADSAA